MKKRKEKIHRNTKSKILNYFYYKEEFINWYEKYKNKGFPVLDVHFNKRWEKILEFEECNLLENQPFIPYG